MLDNEVIEYVNGAINKLISDVQDVLEGIGKGIGEVRGTQPTEAVVIAVAEKDSEEEDTYGFGAVQVISPDKYIWKLDYLWVSPQRLIRGRYEIPKVGENVWIFSPGGDGDRYSYYGASALAKRFFPEGVELDFDYSQESLGFTKIPGTDITREFIGGRYIDKVTEKPGKARVIESSDTFVFFEDEDLKLLELRGGDAYDMKITVGDNGTIYIGQSDELLDGNVLTSCDIEINPGINGKFEVNVVQGDVKIESSLSTISIINSTGNIELTNSTGDITLSTESGKLILEGNSESMKSILQDLMDKIKLITVPTALGPSGVPINAADFTSLKTRIGNMLG